ncbi:sigma-70 family RNA polymerase sigma factor [Phytohabitans houttuyneae]|uniref:RNA polymerase sigma24 factor n=1 Tax=Phytohabitans houttuyneae TaxID=1076126 RepID=A0A6V8KPC3_9ACTN|nr:sigma-70 family RNA polymerase sigma factor [Phytohabitans houttuyneae]GFJ85250.1 RNA polymerase sigma24 factor [Phytohabitans houttuyneae]
MTAGAAAADLVAHRPMLFGLAYRLLGSAHDAEDVLQDAYLRWLGADRAAVAEPRRYLSRIVTHLAMDRLRARQAEPYVGPWLPEPLPAGDVDPAEHRESLSLAMLHLLERLTPPERAVYVLRTAFDLPYPEIAEILDRTPEDCRQLHHRATGHLPAQRRFTAAPAERERLLDRFLAAAREGDLAALKRLLAADAVAWSDGGGRVKAARRPIVGADRVARFFAGIYSGVCSVCPVMLAGEPATIVGRHVLTLDVTGGVVTGVYLIGNPDKLRRFPELS